MAANPLVTAIKKKSWRFASNKIAARPNGTKLMHGTMSRIRPGERLHPGDQGGMQEKGVYATRSKRVARTSAVAFSPKGHVHSFPKQGHENWHTTKQIHPNMAHLQNPHRHPGLEVNSAKHIKSTHIEEVHFDANLHAKHEQEALEGKRKHMPAMQTTAGLWHYHGEAMQPGHKYLNKGRKVPATKGKTKTSKLAYDNIPSHTSAQGQNRMPVGTTVHSQRGRGARRHSAV